MLRCALLQRVGCKSFQAKDAIRALAALVQRCCSATRVLRALPTLPRHLQERDGSSDHVEAVASFSSKGCFGELPEEELEVLRCKPLADSSNKPPRPPLPSPSMRSMHPHPEPAIPWPRHPRPPRRAVLAPVTPHVVTLPPLLPS